jgi:hypothetical protein
MIFETPMVKERYRLRTTTIATGIDNGMKTAFEIPAGEHIVVLERVQEHPWDERTRQVEVEWDGRPVRMFAVDIRERGLRMSDETLVLG